MQYPIEISEARKALSKQIVEQQTNTSSARAAVSQSGHVNLALLAPALSTMKSTQYY